MCVCVLKTDSKQETKIEIEDTWALLKQGGLNIFYNFIVIHTPRQQACTQLMLNMIATLSLITRWGPNLELDYLPIETGVTVQAGILYVASCKMVRLTYKCSSYYSMIQRPFSTCSLFVFFFKHLKFRFVYDPKHHWCLKQ